MKVRSPQLSLRLEAEPPEAAVRWHDGAAVPFLGGYLRLKLTTESADADSVHLHLQLPPGATARQIQDGAEAWLRRQATRVIDQTLSRLAGEAGAPRWSLSFAARAHWTEVRRDGTLRLNWRLIEQPQKIIEQTLAAALATLPPAPSGAPLDLLSAPAPGAGASALPA